MRLINIWDVSYKTKINIMYENLILIIALIFVFNIGKVLRVYIFHTELRNTFSMADQKYCSND